MTLTRRSLLAAAAIVPAIQHRATMSHKLLLVTLDDVDARLWARARHPRIDAIPACSFDVAWGSVLCSNFRARRETGLAAHRTLMGANAGMPPHPNWALGTGTGALLAQLLPGSKVALGKWHLDGRSDPTTHPLDCGYDYYLGSWKNFPPEQGENYSGWTKTEMTRLRGVRTYWTTAYPTQDTANDIRLEINRHAELVQASFNCAHAPFHVPPPHMHGHGNPEDDETKALAMLEAFDWCFGPVFVDALRRGYVVILTSDNGSATSIGGKKGSLYEIGGLRVPLLVWGPGVVPGSRAQMVQATDLWETCLDVRGALGAAYSPDSISFWRICQDPDIDGRTHIQCDAWSSVGEPPQPGDWKRAVRGARYKLWDLGGARRLYDLLLDPWEMTNLLQSTLSSEEEEAYEWLVERLPQ